MLLVSRLAVPTLLFLYSSMKWCVISFASLAAGATYCSAFLQQTRSGLRPVQTYIEASTRATTFASIAVAAVLVTVFPASAAPAQVVEMNDPSRLKKGLRELDYLLTNWDAKTTYCNFGEFQRDLLKPENKKKLLKAAAETGLLDYDKSATMNVVCKKDPQVVRAFVGLTKDNLILNQADVLMKKQDILSLVDDIETYVEDVETFQRAVANIDSLTYSARSDYGSTETTTAGEDTDDSKSYLTQSKRSVEAARDALIRICTALHL